MKQLPGAESATIDDTKLTGYLLDRSHSAEAAAKARFFSSFGFSRANWVDLKAALRGHPLKNAVTSSTANRYGVKYVVSCSLTTPDGRDPCIVSVWIIEPPDPNPSFVTAYPSP